MANSYKRFEWYFSGITSEEEAKEKLDNSLNAFRASHDETDWTIVSTVSPTKSGWRCGFTAEKSAGG